MNFANESVCLMADKVWNEPKLSAYQLVDRLTALGFTAISAVHAREFMICQLGRSYQLL
jgi:hypothetical protein